jgi:hypothetical protein
VGQGGESIENSEQASTSDLFTHLKWTFVCRGRASQLLDAPAQIRLLRKLKPQNAAPAGLPRRVFLFPGRRFAAKSLVLSHATRMVLSAFRRPVIDRALYFNGTASWSHAFPVGQLPCG